MQENLTSFAYGLLTAIILALVQQCLIYIASYISGKNKYTVNGFYVSKYISAFDDSIIANDLVLIRSLKSKITIKYQQYYNKSDKCKVFYGEGYIGNNSRIAVSYQYNDNSSFQNGVMLMAQIDLEATKKAYSGKFYEFDTRIVKAGGHKVIGSESRIYGIDYVLIPTNLKLMQKIKFILNKRVYESHELILTDFNELYG